MASEPSKTNPVASFRPKPVPPAPVPALGQDATLEFAAEGGHPAAGAGAADRNRRITMAAVGLCAIAGVGIWAWFTFAAAGGGSLRVDSDPPGADVRIDGVPRGTTPLVLTLPAGRYTLAVQQGADVKQMPVDIARGVGSAYHVAWAGSAAGEPEATTGSLSIVSDTPGGVVSVDGADRGPTPLTVTGLAPGRHDVIVRTGSTTYRRSVDVEPGATVSLVISEASPAALPWGWISLTSPFVMQVLEDGRVVGTSEIDRIMLSPGNHDLEFVSEPFGFRESRSVRVSSGRASPVVVDVPQVAMNINALPWAEVFIDGVRHGDTPLARVMQPVGDHELVFRHPQFGEKRQVVRLTLRESPRIAVDMRTQ